MLVKVYVTLPFCQYFSARSDDYKSISNISSQNGTSHQHIISFRATKRFAVRTKCEGSKDQ